MNLRTLLGRGIAWILALAFALLAGAHAFDTLVLVPLWSANPPASILAWLENPATQEIQRNVVAFFSLFVPALAGASVAALLIAIAARPPRRAWLVAASLCGLFHFSLIMLFFVPTNTSLGFFSGSVQLSPELVPPLVNAWVRWNGIRFASDLLGFVLAVQAAGEQRAAPNPAMHATR